MEDYKSYPRRNPSFQTRDFVRVIIEGIVDGVIEFLRFNAPTILFTKAMPACVVASQGAMIFGDLSDAKSKVRELLRTNFTIRRKPFLGTNPQVYYIV